MSQDHEKSGAEKTSVSDEIHPEAAPFEPSYQPETLPQISVPDLPDDAQGLTAEALAQVPTLTEQVDADDGPLPEVVPESEVVGSATEVLAEEQETLAHEESAQDTPAQADTWGEELQVRMGKLNGDIQTLNARLDRLEERNKTKA